jgi:soluble lytic murein transglycosylase-like protein
MLHSTAKFVASRSGESFRADRLTDARYNIRLSTYYLANDLYRYHKSWYVAVKYYGEGTNRYANSVMKKAGEYSKILNVPLI